MAQIELRNESKEKFVDISSEEYREYEFRTKVIRIDKPAFLSVSKSGGHRILDEDGISHYISSAFLHISWKAKDGRPHFVK